MDTLINNTRLEIVLGDITEQDTVAIVNAANNTLLGGGGVDGAIHRAGGPAILDECKSLGGCETGDAKLTTGGNLKARYVIHTVGPVYRDSSDAGLLSSCYRRSLETASEKGIPSISFPSISTGAYGYPIEQASRVALNTVIDYVRMREDIELVRFVLFTEGDFETYRKALEEILHEAEDLAAVHRRRDTMASVKIRVYKAGSTEAEMKITIPLGVLRIASKLLPKKAADALQAEGIDLNEIAQQADRENAKGTLIEIEEKGERVIISIE